MLAALLQLARWLLPLLLPLLMFSLGTAVPFRIFLQAFRSPLLARAAVLTFLLVPALALGVVALVPAQPSVAFLIVLMALCPGVALLVLKVRRGEGRVARGLAISLVLTLGTVVLLPVTLWLLSALYPAELPVPGMIPMGLGVAARILPPALLPLAAGFGLAALAPDLAHRLDTWARRAFLVVLAFAAALLLLGGARAIAQLDPGSVAAMALMLAISLVAGHLLGGSDPDSREVLTVAAVFGNPAVVLFVAASIFPDLRLGPLVAFYLVLRLLVLGVYQRWAKAHREHRPVWRRRRVA